MGILDDNLDISVEMLEKVMIKDLIHRSDYNYKDRVTLDDMVYKKPRKVKDPWAYVLTIGIEDGKYLVKWEHFRRVPWRRSYVFMNRSNIHLREFQMSKESYNL